MLSLLETERTFLLFDEVENGINPELRKKLVYCLLNANQQVMVTTHSPMLLNYLPDEDTRKSVILLYRNHHGYTQAKCFFDLPVPAKKLTLLGPGEVFADTYREDIIESIGGVSGQLT